MVNPITAAEARAALRDARSEASDPEVFDARRRTSGWLFVWRRDQGQPPIGTRSWVVADDGTVRAVPLGGRADDVLAEILPATDG